MGHPLKFDLEVATETPAQSYMGRFKAWGRRRWMNWRKERVRFKLNRAKAFELNRYAEAADVAWPVMVEAAVLASIEEPAGMMRIVGLKERPFIGGTPWDSH